jgi:hypothetical protein
MSVDLSSSGGALSINDVEGEFTGHSGGGGFNIQNASGRTALTTGGGDVHVSNSTLDGRVSTGGGEVVISNVQGGLRATSGSGPVITYPGGGQRVTNSVSTTNTVNVTGGMTANISAGGVRTNVSSAISDRSVLRGSVAYTMSKPGGNIRIDDVPNGAELSTGGGRIQVGSSSGFLSVSTGGGDIELPGVGGSASVWTGAGNVTITVVNKDGSEHSVDVFSGNGRVVLDLPSTIDATFELEAAYTENKSRPTIDSDFPLQNSETLDWDSSMGSPRRFVRARGTVGSGRGLIRIRVVNGDIVVRRGR